ncbi:flagellar hook-length control protein FliK [Pseudomonas knackmussii]|uniref:flagellar hook-length control protein FliK n=1 Tax=Pseudomonas knackmussii TaxID=65741 RepID=UPI00136229DB|nr:flagellar hook-length control protein FliK [Pseudomonas knackmussii]
MAVAPDILLSPPSAPSARTTASRAAQDSTATTNDKGSSFADVYAQENRAAPPERPAAHARPSRDKAKAADDSSSDDSAKAADSGSDQPKVADDGKALPADAQDKTASSDDKPDEASLDPLLALGLGAQLPAPATPDATPLTGQAQLNAANSDGDLQKLNQAQGVNLLPGADATAATDSASVAQNLQAQLQGQAKVDTDVKGAGADKAEDGKGKFDMQSLLAGLTGQAAKADDGKTADGDLQALTAQLPENARETKTETNKDAFAGKLEALTQALNGTPQALTNRPVNPQVPGQPVAMQQNGWTDQVVDRVMWMSSQNLKSADIQMEPADLGRLEVRIHMTSDQTQVTFASANAGVREALDSQQHRLRDLFNQQGMTQVNVNVSDQSLARGWQGQQQGSGNGNGRGGSSTASSDGDDEPMLSGVSEIRARPQLGGLGMVDYYA